MKLVIVLKEVILNKLIQKYSGDRVLVPWYPVPFLLNALTLAFLGVLKCPAHFRTPFIFGMNGVINFGTE